MQTDHSCLYYVALGPNSACSARPNMVGLEGRADDLAAYVRCRRQSRHDDTGQENVESDPKPKWRRLRLRGAAGSAYDFRVKTWHGGNGPISAVGDDRIERSRAAVVPARADVKRAELSRVSPTPVAI